MDTVYLKWIWIMKGKTKICYGMNLDFYDLEDSDLNKLESYENKTVRYKGDWYVIKHYEKRFFSEKTMDEFPRYWIKKPYKKPEPITNI